MVPQGSGKVLKNDAPATQYITMYVQYIF